MQQQELEDYWEFQFDDFKNKDNMPQKTERTGGAAPRVDGEG